MKPRIYVDEDPVPGGVAMLDSYPLHLIHMMEVYAGGTMIRSYTEPFMESAARRRLLPMNIW